MPCRQSEHRGSRLSVHILCLPNKRVLSSRLTPRGVVDISGRFANRELKTETSGNYKVFTAMSRADGTIRATGSDSSVSIYLIFQPYLFQSLRNVWISFYPHVANSHSLSFRTEVVWCQGGTSIHGGEIRRSNVSNLFVLVFHGCFALQSEHNCHKREVGPDGAGFIFYTWDTESAGRTFNIKAGDMNSRQMAFKQRGSDAFINRINRTCHLCLRGARVCVCKCVRVQQV